MFCVLTNLKFFFFLFFFCIFYDSKLGFTKVKAPNSHNRKRLAIESRRHASPDDSHMFIIKLPPNMYYYSNPKESLMNSGGKSSHLQNTASKSTASTSLTSATIFPASSTSTTASSILNSNNGKEVIKLKK